MQIIIRKLNNISKNLVELKPNIKRVLKKEVEKIQIQMVESHSNKPWVIIREKEGDKKKI